MLDTKTIVCLIWVRKLSTINASGRVTAGIRYQNERSPIAAFVATPIAIWSLMLFLGSARIFIQDAFFSRIVLSLMLGIICSVSAAQQQGAQPATVFVDDPKASSFVAQLLSKMTLEEKLGQMTQIAYQEKESVSHDERIRNEQAGSFLFVKDPVEINRLQHIAVDQTRLQIPLIFGFDVIHGFRTIYPIPLALASSWDPAEAQRAQSMAAREASAVGIKWTFAPMVDIARDPRWGRIMEGAGEDPYLGSRMAEAQVRGFQGDAIGSSRPHSGLCEALRRLWRSGRRTRLRLCQYFGRAVVECLSAAFPCRRAGWNRLRDERLHGSERRPGHGQQISSARCSAKEVGLPGLCRKRLEIGGEPEDTWLCR